MLSTLQRTERKQNYNRREHKSIGRNPLAGTKNWRIETDRRRESIFIRYGKEIHNQRTKIASTILGTGTFQTIYLRKTN